MLVFGFLVLIRWIKGRGILLLIIYVCLIMGWVNWWCRCVCVVSNSWKMIFIRLFCCYLRYCNVIFCVMLYWWNSRWSVVWMFVVVRNCLLLLLICGIMCSINYRCFGKYVSCFGI